jgi:acyl transferase domain-containing protein/acyl carrier protein
MSDTSRAPVAIVGIGCRFPGAVVDPASFWELLIKGQDAIGEIPQSRIDLAHYFDARPATPGRIMTRWGGFLKGIEDFDAGFFGISPREAERLDPQQRLLLETAWEALEDAGVDADTLNGSATGVFVGQWLSDFEARLFADPEAVDFFMTTGSGRYASSGRLSYLLGLRGPSLTLDTACSSSLAAVHLAVRSIRSGESELAIAGGANVILQPHISIAYSQSRMMAPDGRCKFGDAKGDGYVRSEGAGLVVLKSLSRAQADGDRIYALIEGSAVNNDGRASGSMGTPSQLGQEELLRSAYRDAGRLPGEVSYIEAHGTGTRAGDPVELGALGAVLSEGRAPGLRARVGSVKTNFGHTEGAAGVAGLIKVALALHRGTIPPSLHCNEPNPAIPWEQLPLDVARSGDAWPVAQARRLAGVSAFGIAGTNAHVVLAGAPEAPCVASNALRRSGSLLVLSAKDEAALRALAARYADLLSAGAPLTDVCWSAATRRTALERRAGFVAGDATAMIDALRRYSGGEAAAAEGTAYGGGLRPRIAFVCPGQGAQWQGMARELLSTEPVFRATLAQCDAAARPYADWSIVDQLMAEPGDANHQLDRIDVIQPVLVALAIAYAAMWRELGVRPDAVVGHSMGEVAAACIAGALSLEQAMRIICRRSALMRKTSGQGAMALVDLSMADAHARLVGREQDVSVAVSNSPRSCVISGRPDAVSAVMTELERDNVFCRLVKVDVASHSPQMQPLAHDLATELTDMATQALEVPLYSTVLARQADAGELGASYWAHNLRQPVRFGAAVERMLADDITVFVELGPHPVLLPSIEQTAQAVSVDVVPLACARRGEPEEASMLAALGALHCNGVALDWVRVMPGQGRFVDLPLYPWQRERHWIAAADVSIAGAQGHGHSLDSGHPVLGHGVELAGVPTGGLWTPSLEPARIPAWFEHGLHGSLVFPASAYLELVLAAARALDADATLSVRDLKFERAWHLQADTAASFQLQARADGHGGLSLDIQSRADAGWLQHASARLSEGTKSAAGPWEVGVIERLRQTAPLDGDEVYARLQAQGAHFGAHLRGISRAWLSRGEALAQIDLKPLGDFSDERFCFAPAVLDACFQLTVLLAPEGALCLPSAIAAVQATRVPRGELWLHARARPATAGADAAVVDAVLLDAEGPVLELQGLTLHKLDPAAATDARLPLFDVHWAPLLAPEAAVPPLSRQWLLVADAQGEAGALAEALKRRGESATVLDGVALLNEALEGAANGCRMDVIDLRALDLVSTEGAADAAFDALLQPARLLGQVAASAPLRLWWVTRGAQAAQAADGTTLALAQSPVSGLAAVLAVEQGDRWGGTVDLDPDLGVAEQADALIEAVRADAGSVASRQGQRLQARLRRLEARPPAVAPRWRKDASYLITGGLGGVGAHVARWLAHEGVRHLVVMSRSALPPRVQWSAIDPASAPGRAIATVRELEALGASVQHVALDVADGVALNEWHSRFAAEGRPPVQGVFHLAGITDDKLVRDLDAASLGAVLSPKLRGAANLHRLLPELDVFVLFSSMAALMPQAGQASYAAANAFLDALARQRRASGQHALSIGWGVWAQTGVMQGDVGRQQLDELTRQGIGSFTPSQALSVLAEVLSLPVAHVAAMPIDWARLRTALSGRRVPLLQDLLDEARAETVGDGNGTAPPEVSSDPVERRRALERAVREVVGRVLKLAPAKIDARKPLGTMGLTSLMALELRNRLEPLHGRPLSATLAWNYPTVEALVGFLFGAVDPAPVAAAPAATSAPPPADVAEVLSGVNELSDEDAARLLRKRR